MRKQGMLFVLTLLLASTALPAEDAAGADRILCTAVQATRCSMDDDCWTGQPWNWNIPQFIEIDFKKEELSTTAASHENRVTPIKNLERKDGIIYLQGVEGGRAFSFVIVEATSYFVPSPTAKLRDTSPVSFMRPYANNTRSTAFLRAASLSLRVMA